MPHEIACCVGSLSPLTGALLLRSGDEGVSEVCMELIVVVCGYFSVSTDVWCCWPCFLGI